MPETGWRWKGTYFSVRDSAAGQHLIEHHAELADIGRDLDRIAALLILCRNQIDSRTGENNGVRGQVPLDTAAIMNLAKRLSEKGRVTQSLLRRHPAFRQTLGKR